MRLPVYTPHMWMAVGHRRSWCCFTGSALSARDGPDRQGQGALPPLGPRRKTFLRGQRANAPLPAIRDDGIGGA